MAAKPKTIDEYLAALSDDKRTTLEKLRKTIKATVPEAQECINYGLAAFRFDGKPLVAFGATANHCAFYLMSGSTVEAHQGRSRGLRHQQGHHPLSGGRSSADSPRAEGTETALSRRRRPTTHRQSPTTGDNRFGPRSSTGVGTCAGRWWIRSWAWAW
jgi:Domain of unknown function (DU1801)